MALFGGSRDTAAARNTNQDFSALLDSVRGIRWPARSAVRGGIPGAHNSRMRGSSAEFTEYRPYRQGDDLRRIDWKLFARSDRAYIRLSNDRAILPTTIVLDATASMAFPVDTLGKWNLASQLAVGLAAVARTSADPVGLVVARSHEIAQLPPRTRQSAIHEMMRAVRETNASGSQPLAPAFDAASRVSGRIVLLTDFLGDADELLTTVSRAVVAGKEVHAIHIVAPDEIEPPQETLLVSDPEDPEIRRPLNADARDQYLRRFAEWRDAIAHDWSDAGVAYSVAVVGREDPDHIIRRVTSLRGIAASA
jgi:uncharacterized protein (DUF58 family)